MTFLERLKQLLIAVDQLANTVYGLFSKYGAWADETLSCRAWRIRERNPYLWRAIDLLFWFDPRHCYESYRSEQLRVQLPPELRDDFCKLNDA